MLSFVIRNRLALINLGLWVLVGVLTYYGLKYLLPFVVPLIFGTLIAVLFEPVVKLFVRIKFPRWLASVTALFLFFGGGATVLLLLTAKLVIELKDFAVKIPQLSAGLMARGEDLLHQGVALYGQLSPSMSDQVRTQMDKAGKTLGEIGAGMADSTVKAITNVPSMVTIFLLALIISFFLLKDFPIWQQRLLRLLHPTVREKGDVVLDDLGKATFGYLRAQAILIGITFVQVLVGLLVLHVPYAFSLSVLAAFLDILPLLGTGSLFVPWGIYMLATGNTKL
ncbi:MAG TPA: AI-2E family transporter, partial [Bacilli bacterium]|nr:AI-2E family transporter [Bacilli bacterium]